MIRTKLQTVILAAIIVAGASVAAENASITTNPAVRVYTVNKRVADFPTNEDLSTPEGAYAAIHRAFAAEGDSAWPRLSVPELAARMPKAASRPLPPEDAQRLLNAEILEVCVFENTNAVIFARKDDSIDLRWVQLPEGHWLNTGNDEVETLEEARALVARRRAFDEAKRTLSSRPPVTNPEAHLRPFVQFLQREAREPQEFLLSALATHRVVILGEVHHRPRYWAFNAGLVRARGFPKTVGVIYLELPSNDQALVDQFLAAPRYDPQPVISMLRDNLWLGWPDQPMLDFFKTVWEVNQSLSKKQRLRIVLVDMERPWKEIKAREDWGKYEADRDGLMATNIARDLREHAAEPRHALFIVGWMHATRNLSEPDGTSIQSAGRHLREVLGDTNVFAVFPHCPVMANMGGVKGRLAQGLFETAFAGLTNRPMAFPLDHGPFGQLPFDASLDSVTTNSYCAGFDAYLYLGPLEGEIFSNLIPGFYTDEFVQELDRRHRLEFGQGLMDAYHFPKLDAESFIKWMSRAWGQPRREWSAFALGPLDAWRYGSESEKALLKDSLPKAAWTFAGQATPEAAFQSMLWAAHTGDFDSFVISFPPEKKPAAQEFDEAKSRTQSIAGFSIASKETLSENEVILNVVLEVKDPQQGGQAAIKGQFIMKKLNGKWKYAGDVDEQ
jgi:hypothetical protein